MGDNAITPKNNGVDSRHPRHKVTAKFIVVRVKEEQTVASEANRSLTVSVGRLEFCCATKGAQHPDDTHVSCELGKVAVPYPIPGV
jgi:hypothetical protein